MKRPTISENSNPSVAAQWMDILSQMEARRDLIEAALHYTGGTHIYDDVVSMVMQGRLFWRVLPNSFMIFEVMEYPRQRHLHGFLAGGKLEEIKAAQNDVIELARLAGCTTITLGGRRGWVKALQQEGWKESCVTIALTVPSQPPDAEQTHVQEGRVHDPKNGS